jgi:hypothetical protein
MIILLAGSKYTVIHSCYSAVMHMNRLHSTHDSILKYHPMVNGLSKILDKLNAFYAHFEANNIEACMREPTVPYHCLITLSVADVSKSKVK